MRTAAADLKTIVARIKDKKNPDRAASIDRFFETDRSEGDGIHSDGWNRFWDAFTKRYDDLGRCPTVTEVLDELLDLMDSDMFRDYYSKCTLLP